MRRAPACLATAVAPLLVALASSVAFGAVSDVRLGNFYYEDATVGDGMIEIVQGDQLRFIAEDNGPGTPHTVEVDELDIHSGGLSTGQTYTTPVIDQTGTFELYCKFHKKRGHVTTLVVRPGSSTTTAPTTTAPSTTAASTTQPSDSTTTPSEPSTTRADGSGTTSSPSVEVTTTGQPAGSSAGRASTTLGPTESAPTDTSTTASTGLGQLSEDELAALPTPPSSLEAALGRPPARPGPWTRSVRLAFLAAPPLAAVAVAAVLRYRRLSRITE